VPLGPSTRHETVKGVPAVTDCGKFTKEIEYGGCTGGVILGEAIGWTTGDGGSGVTEEGDSSTIEGVGDNIGVGEATNSGVSDSGSSPRPPSWLTSGDTDRLGVTITAAAAKATAATTIVKTWIIVINLSDAPLSAIVFRGEPLNT